QEPAGGTLQRTGPARLAEELRSIIGRRQRAADDHHERRLRPIAAAREIAGEHLAPAAELAGEENVCVVMRDARDLLAQPAHRLTAADGRDDRRDEAAAPHHGT